MRRKSKSNFPPKPPKKKKKKKPFFRPRDFPRGFSFREGCPKKFVVLGIGGEPIIPWARKTRPAGTIVCRFLGPPWPGRGGGNWGGGGECVFQVNLWAASLFSTACRAKVFPPKRKAGIFFRGGRSGFFWASMVGGAKFFSKNGFPGGGGGGRGENGKNGKKPLCWQGGVMGEAGFPPPFPGTGGAPRGGRPISWKGGRPSRPDFLQKKKTPTGDFLFFAPRAGFQKKGVLVARPGKPRAFLWGLFPRFPPPQTPHPPPNHACGKNSGAKKFRASS